LFLHDYPQSMPRMYLYYIMTAGGDTQGGGIMEPAGGIEPPTY